MGRFLSAAFAAVVMFAPAAALADDPSLSDAANQAFLARNAKLPGVTVLPDGVQYIVLAPGAGNNPQPTDKVDVIYSGMLINGKVFDQSQPDAPASFIVYQLIPGWVEALTKMRPGAHWHVAIPANLAYGARGVGNGLVPPNQTLVFDMQLVAIHRGDD